MVEFRSLVSSLFFFFFAPSTAIFRETNPAREGGIPEAIPQHTEGRPEV